MMIIEVIMGEVPVGSMETLKKKQLIKSSWSEQLNYGCPHRKKSVVTGDGDFDLDGNSKSAEGRFPFPAAATTHALPKTVDMYA